MIKIPIIHRWAWRLSRSCFYKGGTGVLILQALSLPTVEEGGLGGPPEERALARLQEAFASPIPSEVPVTLGHK